MKKWGGWGWKEGGEGKKEWGWVGLEGRGRRNGMGEAGRKGEKGRKSGGGWGWKEGGEGDEGIRWVGPVFQLVIQSNVYIYIHRFQCRIQSI